MSKNHPDPLEGSDYRWQYIGLTGIEESFKNLKGDLAMRPVFHQKKSGSKLTSS